MEISDRDEAGESYATLVVRAFREARARTVLVSEEAQLTGSEALARVGAMQAVATGLCAPKTAPRLAILARNRPDSWLIQVAVQALGGSAVWLHPRGSLPDHRTVVEDAEPDILLVDPAIDPSASVPLAESFARTGPVIDLLGEGLGESLPDGLAQAAVRQPALACRPADIALLAYTGGTTGRPKAVVRTQASWARIAKLVLSDLGMARGTRFLAAGPISHVTGTKLLPALLTGGAIHFPGAATPSGIAEAIERWRITSTLLVPTALGSLLDSLEAQPRDISGLRQVFYGGAAIAPDLLRRAVARLGPVLHQVYGQAEGYPLTHLRPEDLEQAPDDRWRSCGRPVPSVRTRLVDRQGREVPAGEAGELLVKAPQVMERYFRRPAETETAFLDGWLRTGDLARRHADGFLEIVGRTKDMIVTGGFNVYAREVEMALEEHPEVAAAAVYGLPHPKWGEAVTASVVLTPDAAAGESDLIDHVRARKGAYQAPKALNFLPHLPMTAIGKVDKTRLKEAWKGRT